MPKLMKRIGFLSLLVIVLMFFAACEEKPNSHPTYIYPGTCVIDWADKPETPACVIDYFDKVDRLLP